MHMHVLKAYLMTNLSVHWDLSIPIQKEVHCISIILLL